MLCEMQDVEWAKKHRRTGFPVEGKCALCLRTCSAAFPGLSWEQIVSKMKVSDPFRKKVAEAVRVASGKSVAQFNGEDVYTESIVGHMIERKYELMSLSEFQSRYKISAEEAGLSFEQFQDEHGQPLQAIPIKAGARKLKVYSITGVALQEWIHSRGGQVRGQQGRDIRDLYLDDARSIKTSPRVLRKAHGKVSYELSELQELAEAALEKKKEEELDRARLAALQKEAGEAPDEPEQPAEEVEVQQFLFSDDEIDKKEEEFDAIQLPGIQLPSERQRLAAEEAKKASAKTPKDKGRGKGSTSKGGRGDKKSSVKAGSSTQTKKRSLSQSLAGAEIDH